MSSPTADKLWPDLTGALRRLSDREDRDLSFREQEPLSRHSSMRVGGPASLWVEVGDRKSLIDVLETAGSTRDGQKGRGNKNGVDVYPVGLGSNVIFPDGGIDGLVLRLTGVFDGWTSIQQPGDGSAHIRVGAGTVNAHLVRGLLDAGWTGLEFLNLVPGTFGGAVALNAGTKEAELSERLMSVEWCRPASETEGFDFERVDAEALSMSYRYAEIPERAIVVSGDVKVESGDVEAARSRMNADRERRDETQPYKLASAGSTFANPDNDYAGRLIDEAGLKGKRIGGARISEHHANFFINDDDATAEDVLSLMALARVRVRQRFGVDLRPEVRCVGFDGLSRMRELEAQWDSRDSTRTKSEKNGQNGRGASAPRHGR